MDIEKPTRGPDYESPHGQFFWFQELIYIDHASIFHAMERDSDNSKLFMWKTKRNGEMEKNYFADHIQEAHSAWLYETFEKYFLGEK